MIYEYSELKGIIKVGDKVRAVPGKANECALLENDGSNTQLITHVDGRYFYIDGCNHPYCDNSYLEIVEPPRSLENLKIGDILVAHYGEKTVLGVCGRVFFLSFTDEPKRHGDTFTLEDMIAKGWTLKTEEPVTEYTLDEALTLLAEHTKTKKEMIRIKD